jgi:Carboxypeptidase regulatory-like domain/TonB dependent receptor
MPTLVFMRRHGIPLTLSLFLTYSALAQTGLTLLITVIDENGVAVRAARVLISSRQLAGLRCETDFAGRCRFVNLSAGTYRIHVEKQDYYSLTLSSVQFPATANLEMTLSHQQEVREVVNVVESPPAIDPAQTSSIEKLSGLDVVNIPYPSTRDYRNVLNFIPGVVNDPSGQPHIAGSATYQTLVLLDGFNVSQPANGQLLAHISTDAFRSVEVETTRIPAENGKGSAGVLALNTGIGDDRFRFIATNFTPSVQTKKGIAFDSIDPRITISGPIRKGKMWFFDALDGEYDNNLVVSSLLPNGAETDTVWRVGNLAKVQTNLSSRNILTTSVLVNHLDNPHAGLSPQNPIPAPPSDIESVYLASIKDQHYFSGGELLEAGVGFDQYNLALTPQGTLPYVLTPQMAGGNFYLSSHTLARRWQALSNLYLPPQPWHGRHEVKIGGDFDWLSYAAEFRRRPISFWRQNPPQPTLCPLVTGTMCSRYSTFAGGALSKIYNLESSAYAQDRWLMTDRLLIETGLRFDWDQIVRDVLVSPRLAGTYVLDNEGNTKISAGIGIVYDATPLFLISRPSAGQRTDYFFNSSGLPTDVNGAPTSAPTPLLTTFFVNRGTLQAPRYVNWSLALEKKLPRAIYLKAEFLKRDGAHGFVYNPPSGAPAGRFLLQNTRNDRYRSFHLELRHSFRESYMVMGSYTRSQLRSNQVLDFNVDNPLFSRQAAGPYSWDVPNRFLSWGLLPFFKLPILHKVDLAYSVEARSGFAFNVVNSQQQLVGVPGSQRFPAYFSLNTQLEKRFHFLGAYWAVRGGLNNVTGHGNPVSVNNNISSPQFLTFSNFAGRAVTTRIRFLGRK